MTRKHRNAALDARGWTPAEAASVAALSLALAGSVLAPILLAGRPGAWAFPSLDFGVGEAFLRGLIVAGATFGALRLFQTLHERLARGAIRALLIFDVVLALALIFNAVGPLTHIGDWVVLLRVAESGELIGKWYLIAALYASFHHTVGALLGLTAQQSVCLVSSLAGAATAYLYYRIVDQIGLARVFKGWPLLYLSAFAVTGIGLGHMEIYVVVALLLGLFFWTGLRFLDGGRVGDGLAFCIVLGVCIASYIGLVLLLPVALVACVWRLWRDRAHGVRLWAMIFGGVALTAAPLLACQFLGPAPADPMIPHKLWHLIKAAPMRERPFTPSHLPRGVSWTLVRSLVRPNYWFAPWRVADLAQVAWLSDRVGWLLLAALGAAAGFTWRRSRAALTSPAVLLTASATALFGVHGFLTINGLPFPWDWDMSSYVALCTSVCAAALLATLSPQRGYRAAVTALLVGVALCSQLSGMHFFVSVARPPDAFGPPSGRLRLAATPTRLTLSEDRRATIWWWLHNDGDAPVRLNSPEGVFEVGGRSGSWIVHTPPEELTFPGALVIPPGKTVCFTRLDLVPQRFEVSPAASDAAQILWKPFDEAARDDVYTGLWQVRLNFPRENRPSIDLVSNEIELRLTKSRGVIE